MTPPSEKTPVLTQYSLFFSLFFKVIKRLNHSTFFHQKIMATNTLGEFSDGEDENVWEWSDPEADDIIRNINEEEILARVYGNDDAVIRDSNQEEILAGEWSDPEADDIIRNINEEEILARVYGNASDDDVIRNINEEEILARMYGNDDIDEDEVQTGRGQKRKNESDDEESTESEDEQGQYYYHLESSKKYHSKKFGMTATDHKVRFNNVLADFDLLESYESTMKIFHHLLEEVTEGMAPNDKVRFILRSEQLETPISLPFTKILPPNGFFHKSNALYSRIRSSV